MNTKSYLPPPEQPSSGSLKVEFFQHQEKDIKKEEVRIWVRLDLNTQLFSLFLFNQQICLYNQTLT